MCIWQQIHTSAHFRKETFLKPQFQEEHFGSAAYMWCEFSALTQLINSGVTCRMGVIVCYWCLSLSTLCTVGRYFIKQEVSGVRYTFVVVEYSLIISALLSLPAVFNLFKASGHHDFFYLLADSFEQVIISFFNNSFIFSNYVQFFKLFYWNNHVNSLHGTICLSVGLTGV